MMGVGVVKITAEVLYLVHITSTSSPAVLMMLSHPLLMLHFACAHKSKVLIVY